MRITHQSVPEQLLKKHLLASHGKKPSWLEEQGENLSVAHALEHGFRRADHDLTDGFGRAVAVQTGRRRPPRIA